MNDLKLEVGVKINDNEMDQSIKKMQEKLKDISKMSQTPLSPGAQQQQQGQSKIIQDMQARYLDTLNKEHAKTTKEMERIDNLYKQQNRSIEQQIKLQEKMLELKKHDKQVTDTIAANGGAKTPPPGQNPPPNTPPPQPQDEKGNVQAMLKNFLKAGAASAIIQGALNISQNYIRAEGRELLSEAQGTSIASIPLREAMQGKGYESAFFGKERMDALEMAQRQNKNQRGQDAMNIVGRIGIGAAAGAAGGALFGGIGALPGAAIGAIGGFGRSLMDDRSMAKMFDGDRYEKMLTAEGMENFQAFEAANKAKDPLKTMARDFTNQQGRNFLNIQRSTGLGDLGLQSFLEGNMNQGGGKYTLESILQNQQQIAAAGGSSADLRGNNAGVASAANQYGVSNAGGILGRISGAGNQTQATDDTFYRLMTKAVQAGVNLSEMPQELNRFATIATELATAGGGFSEKAVGVFAAGMTDYSAQSMQGAKGFAEQFQGAAGSAGGMEGQIGYGFLLGEGAEKTLGKEGAAKLKEGRLASVLNTITTEELEKNPILAKGYAAQLGVSEDALMDMMSKKDLSKNTKTVRQEESLKKLGQGIGEKQGEELDKYLKSDEGSALYTEAFSSMRLARGSNFRADSVGRSTITGLARLSQGGKGMTDEEVQATEDQLGKPKEGTFEDLERSKATGDIMQTRNLSKYLGDIQESAQAFTESSAQYAAVFNAFVTATKEGGDAMGAFKNELKETLEYLKNSTPQSPSVPKQNQPRTSGSGN